MTGRSRFIPPKGLHSVKAITAIIALSLQKSKYVAKSYQDKT